MATFSPTKANTKANKVKFTSGNNVSSSLLAAKNKSTSKGVTSRVDNKQVATEIFNCNNVSPWSYRFNNFKPKDEEVNTKSLELDDNKLSWPLKPYKTGAVYDIYVNGKYIKRTNEGTFKLDKNPVTCGSEVKIKVVAIDPDTGAKYETMEKIQKIDKNSFFYGTPEEMSKLEIEELKKQKKVLGQIEEPAEKDLKLFSSTILNEIFKPLDSAHFFQTTKDHKHDYEESYKYLKKEAENGSENAKKVLKRFDAVIEKYGFKKAADLDKEMVNAMNQKDYVDQSRDLIEKEIKLSPYRQMMNTDDYNNYKFDKKKYKDAAAIKKAIPQEILSRWHDQNTVNIDDLIKISQTHPEFMKMYEYLCKKKGEEEAAKYLEIISDDVNKMIGMDSAQEWIDSLEDNPDAIKEIRGFMGGFVDGTQSFVDGIGAWIYSNDKRTPEDYEKMYKLQLLGEKYSDIKLDDVYSVGSAIGNMAPSIAISCVSPFAGTVAMGVSAGGNAYHQALVSGHGLGQSIFYGFISGLSEAGLERVLGGVFGVSNAGSKVLKESGFFKRLADFGSSMIHEGIEEGSQEYLDALFRSGILGEEVWMPDVNANALQSAIYGALTAGVINGAAIGTNAMTMLINKYGYSKISDIPTDTREKMYNDLKKQNPVLETGIDKEFFLSHFDEIFSNPDFYNAGSGELTLSTDFIEKLDSSDMRKIREYTRKMQDYNLKFKVKISDSNEDVSKFIMDKFDKVKTKEEFEQWYKDTASIFSLSKLSESDKRKIFKKIKERGFYAKAFADYAEIDMEEVFIDNIDEALNPKAIDLETGNELYNNVEGAKEFLDFKSEKEFAEYAKNHTIDEIAKKTGAVFTEDLSGEVQRVATDEGKLNFGTFFSEPGADPKDLALGLWTRNMKLETGKYKISKKKIDPGNYFVTDPIGGGEQLAIGDEVKIVKMKTTCAEDTGPGKGATQYKYIVVDVETNKPLFLDNNQIWSLTPDDLRNLDLIDEE